MSLSSKQREILCAIARFYSVHGYAIAIEELLEVSGLGVQPLLEELDYLRATGWVNWERYEARTLHLTPKGRLVALEVAIA